MARRPALMFRGLRPAGWGLAGLLAARAPR